ncbi:hypothetical protein SLEP1_g58248 [Rubroshorea leprosula]|uniref:Uncharacterized protein n=1 Tax=Rubroshorea leprosula TaxID=152421 RepID=A0AAV5MQ95_9ROSI|nr:hypothetical protein SLEP1_g58248 [Rubroshorea leprosula]
MKAAATRTFLKMRNKEVVISSRLTDLARVNPARANSVLPMGSQAMTARTGFLMDHFLE